MMKEEEMEEWDDRCRRQLKRSLQERMDYGFVYTYKPVLDDASSRVFNSTKEYRMWCNKNLPSYLRYRSYE
ncbi:MAG: hypothetical protein QME07_02430 [bacterium]|nr:hypothetical protein [bacterium]